MGQQSTRGKVIPLRTHTATATTTWPIASIGLPPDWPRRELGDIAGLASEIERDGLLCPVTVRPDGTLIAGLRRLRACEFLGWSEIPAHVVEGLDGELERLMAFAGSNAQHRPLMPSEAASLAARIEPLIQRRARERMLAGYPVESAHRGKSRDHVARIVGYSSATLTKIKAIIEAAAAEPRKLGSTLAELDLPGARIDRLHRRVRDHCAQKENIASLKAYSRLDISEVAEIRHCTMEDLLDSLDSQSVDAIIADPPYDRLDLYEELARRAARVLKPGGMLAVMTTQGDMINTGAAMAKHIPYRWCVAVSYESPPYRQIIDQITTSCRWNPVLLFGGRRAILPTDVCAVRSATDKRYHKWGHQIAPFAWLVEHLSKPGQLVCDPFVGSGTTAVASVQSGRRFVGCDIDKNAVQVGRGRVAQELQTRA